MNEARIVSVRTGVVREWPRPEWDRQHGATWTTAYHKDEVPGPVRAGVLGLEGDEQASRDVHGGPFMALLAYATSNYVLWRAEPLLAAMGPGAFGENLALEGPDESGVCIGDVWETEGASFAVTQPRGPCAAISRVWNVRDLMQRAVETVRIGWYLRVTREGTIARGETLRLSDRPHPQWTVARVFRLRIGAETDSTALAALTKLEALSPGWRAKFEALAAKS